MPRTEEKIQDFSWTWKPKQIAFITTPKRYAAYVGAMACGKTSAFCRRALAIAQKYPGSRGLLARFTWPEAINVLMSQFLEIMPPAFKHKVRVSDGYLEIYAGNDEHGAFVGDGISVILFQNLEDPKKYRSENFNFFGISQADEQQIVLEHWMELTYRLRRQKGPHGKIPRQYAFLDANYAGHNWIWQLFHPDGQKASGKLEDPDFHPDEYCLVEGKTEDNIENLPADYYRSMDSMPEEWRKRHFLGSWDEFAGKIYHEFGTQHLSDGVMVNGRWEREVPKNWYRYRAIDSGLRNPTACLWATISPGGTVYFYDEYYRPGLAKDHAEAIRDKRPHEAFRFSVIDRSAFNKEITSGESAGQQYFDGGIPVVMAPKHDPGSGITVVKKWMTTLDSETGRPRFQVIKGTCPNLQREIEQYVWDDLTPMRAAKRNEPERPRKVNDHAVDAMRYLLVLQPQPTPMSSDDTHTSRERRRVYSELWEPY